MQSLLAYLPTNIIMLTLLGLVFILGLLFLFSIKKTQWIIYGLIIWFPFESLILRYTPLDYYAYVKYLPEIILYSLTFFSWILYIKNTKKILPKNPLSKWFILYILITVISLILNQYSPFIWLLGLRQTLRFGLVFFVILFCLYEKKILKTFIVLGFSMIIAQAVLGLIQYLAGGRLDPYLFSTHIINIGNSAVLGGLEQFWTPGTRIFATMGRYDRLGSFLALGLIMLLPWMYMIKEKTQKYWYWAAYAVGVLALILTYSRASWLAFFAGVITIGIALMKDKRIMIGLSIFAVVMVGYIGAFMLVRENISNIVETPNQSIPERVLEAVSLRGWRESYHGYGRIFFIINTPRMVVRYHPFFGVGVGNYGGGVAAALLNTQAYDRLKLPFGIQNIYGQIDNSWMSIWGEAGTFGLLVFMGLFSAVIRMGLYVHNHKKNKSERAMGTGLVGLIIGLSVLGFFGPYFEFRTLMFYAWLIIAVVMVYFREEKKKGDLLVEKWK
ncbi:MAG: hypothetical protein HOE80_02835 [Candidatus Magasanikbacteria bacterium]|jgi:hypothetical protein|nr:hypothetical protein [Candidatus Magasanikbacteria bacterium]MBT4071634.1 hypothetical protein [Candidatus Magasanikbacteria bacterium]